MSLLRDQWQLAIDSIEIRHPDHATRVTLHLSEANGPLTLHLTLDNLADTSSGHDGHVATRMNGFNVVFKTIRYWPGLVLAQMWLAAGWAGYLQHEALELVTFAGSDEDRALQASRGDRGPLHPHEYLNLPDGQRYGYPHDRGIRDGWPDDLNRDTLPHALAVVMPLAIAQDLVRIHAPEEEVASIASVATP